MSPSNPLVPGLFESLLALGLFGGLVAALLAAYLYSQRSIGGLTALASSLGLFIPFYGLVAPFLLWRAARAART